MAKKKISFFDEMKRFQTAMALQTPLTPYSLNDESSFATSNEMAENHSTTMMIELNSHTP